MLVFQDLISGFTHTKNVIWLWMSLSTIMQLLAFEIKLKYTSKEGFSSKKKYYTVQLRLQSLFSVVIFSLDSHFYGAQTQTEHHRLNSRILENASWVNDLAVLGRNSA